MKRYFLFILLVLISLGGWAQGVIYESLTFSSTLLGEDVKYSVYLPADYDLSERKYPVLYLLHGYTDDETGWVQFGEVKAIADKAIKSGESTEMIIVMPDAKVSYYSNDHAMKYPWEDMFVKEFIPFVEETYKVRQKKEFRALAGLSMGGFGALKLAMRHNELFSSSVAMSAAVRTDKQIIEMESEKYEKVYGLLYGPNLKGRKRITESWKNNSVFHLMNSIDLEGLNSVRYYIDCGDDDFLIEGNMSLHLTMNKKGIKHEFRVRDGGHSWQYWRTCLPTALEFVSKSFHR
ncbi:esterase family protein [Prolixibacteraceae bacterium JC049]|nr:esterase family protein [Prolixibacteraceae bacterium JC049]